MVYVDNSRNAFGNMIMCHMIADTHDELIDMANKIGLKSSWIQKIGKHDEHFDISLTKRKLAIENGAVECSLREIGLILIRKRNREKIGRK